MATILKWQVPESLKDLGIKFEETEIESIDEVNDIVMTFFEYLKTTLKKTYPEWEQASDPRLLKTGHLRITLEYYIGEERKIMNFIIEP